MKKNKAKHIMFILALTALLTASVTGCSNNKKAEETKETVQVETEKNTETQTAEETETEIKTVDIKDYTGIWINKEDNVAFVIEDDCTWSQADMYGENGSERADIKLAEDHIELVQVTGEKILVSLTLTDGKLVDDFGNAFEKAESFVNQEAETESTKAEEDNDPSLINREANGDFTAYISTWYADNGEGCLNIYDDQSWELNVGNSIFEGTIYYSESAESVVAYDQQDEFSIEISEGGVLSFGQYGSFVLHYTEAEEEAPDDDPSLINREANGDFTAYISTWYADNGEGCLNIYDDLTWELNVGNSVFEGTIYYSELSESVAAYDQQEEFTIEISEGGVLSFGQYGSFILQ